MKTKSKYSSPTIEFIQLDNEISLALESTPPFGPDEVRKGSDTPDFLRSNPINSELA
jgi:hypothetical protein